MRPSQTTPPEGSRAPTSPRFDYVLVGVDTTPESVIAAAQARRLCEPGGYLEVLAIVEAHLAAQAGFSALHAAEGLVAATRKELDFVCELVDPDSFRLVAGSIHTALLAEAKQHWAKLVALGAPRHRRLTARLLGGPDLPLLRDAPCSVLVARAGWGASKPRRILVGVDGSPEATVAEETARALAARLECEFVPLIALGEKPIDPGLLRVERDDALIDPRSAVEALACAPEDNLVVVGSGASSGPRTVSAHIAHEASCSVLVVRPDADTAPATTAARASGRRRRGRQ